MLKTFQNLPVGSHCISQEDTLKNHTQQKGQLVLNATDHTLEANINLMGLEVFAGLIIIPVAGDSNIKE